MTARRHPYQDVEFELLTDGTVKVRDLSSGHEGVFRPDGGWLAGELTYADPQMVLWVAETTGP